ncbi:hypothetical protein ACF3N0_08800 [Moraxella atlantae]|uniref:hypothetical protein n=1 Tax=Faucicola atlantae TaxID=34059 RepID=UPI003752859B
MNKDDVSIWMPIYIGDILAMTTRLTTEQVGGLYLLMMDYWKNGAVPNDVKIISAITGLSSAKSKSFLKTITDIGIFSIENDELFSSYLDDKKSQATDNKNSKSERAKKAAEARWNKESSENQSENLAQDKHNVSNAQAMQEHNTSNAKNMLEQCPSTSSSSINNNTLSNAREVLAKAEQVKQANAEDIQNWVAPPLDEMRSMLFNAGYSGILTEQQYVQLAADFKTYFAEQAIIGKPIVTDALRKNKLRDWIMRDAQKKSKPSYQKKHANEQRFGTAADPLAVDKVWNQDVTPVVSMTFEDWEAEQQSKRLARQQAIGYEEI